MTTSLTALAAYVGWTILLLCIVLGYRGFRVLSMQRKADAWTRGREPEDAALFNRVGDAASNCLETAPLFAAVILMAHVSGQGTVTDSLAMLYVAGRLVQSLSHIISVHHLMIFFVRFPAYVLQIGLLIWWLLMLTGLI